MVVGRTADPVPEEISQAGVLLVLAPAYQRSISIRRYCSPLRVLPCQVLLGGRSIPTRSLSSGLKPGR